MCISDMAVVRLLRHWEHVLLLAEKMATLIQESPQSK